MLFGPSCYSQRTGGCEGKEGGISMGEFLVRKRNIFESQPAGGGVEGLQSCVVQSVAMAVRL